jgi:hypothetical protein
VTQRSDLHSQQNRVSRKGRPDQFLQAAHDRADGKLMVNHERTGAEFNGNRMMVYESYGHLNFVEISVSSDLQPLVRCSECCHPNCFAKIT